MEMVRRKGGQLAMDLTRLRSCVGSPRVRSNVLHVQAITIEIDKYAEKAIDNRTTSSTSPTSSQCGMPAAQPGGT